VIKDAKTGQTIRSITTSPITNRVSQFYPELQGDLNERFSYEHKPYLGQRTFCCLDLSVENDIAKVDVEMVCVPAEKAAS